MRKPRDQGALESFPLRRKSEPVEPIALSVVELKPLPNGALGVAVSTRPRAQLETGGSPDRLTCLFLEPDEVPIRLRIGSARLGEGFVDSEVSEGVWPGCLARLSRAGEALKSANVASLLVNPPGAADPESFWFEVEPFTGTWQRVLAERVRATLDDVGINARDKPFFVHAAGSTEDVSALLSKFRDESLATSTAP